MSRYEKYDEDIKKLHGEGLRNGEIAEIVGIDARRVSDRLKVNGLVSNKRKFNDKPTPEEEVVLISLFIGDGCIYKSLGNINYRVNLAHSLKQKGYFMKKYNRVKKFLDCEYFEETQKHSNGNYHSCVKFQSKVNPYFTRAREKFYKNGKKIIPSDIADYLTDELLAYKFYDDGYLTESGFAISMDDYDKESISNFKQAVEKNFGIEMNEWGNGRKLYVPAKYRGAFKELVLPHATEDVLYKLGEFSETPNE